MNKSPIYGDDKYKLVKMCHDSFKKALSGDEKITYLLDRCDWDELFEDMGNVIHYEAEGRFDSVVRMFELAKTMKGHKLFLEDDYYWRPGTVKNIVKALDHVNLVSPYDHPTHYDRWPDMRLVNINGLVYRSSPSTTHTFASRGDFFDAHSDIFIKYGDQDHPMFEEIPDDMFQPTYSFATHMVEGLLAPNIDWEAMWEADNL